MKINVLKSYLKISLETIDKLREMLGKGIKEIDVDLQDKLTFINNVKKQFTPCIYVIKNSSDEYATRNWNGWTNDINKARTFSNPGHAKLCRKYSNLCKIVKVELKEL